MSRAAYKELVSVFTRLHRYAHADAILSWDFSVNVSNKGVESRAACLAELRSHSHDLITDTKLEGWIETAAASGSALEPNEKANLCEMRRQWRAANALPADLVRRISMANDKCEHGWRTQRGANNWKGFLENFSEVVSLARQEAELLQRSYGFSTPYDALLDKYEPEMTSEKISEAFGSLKSWLPELIRTVVAQQKEATIHRVAGRIPIENQKALRKEAMEVLKFDCDAGRLDVSTHPFCGGVTDDVRITTRYGEDPELAFQSLMGVIHETGHAKYEQHLPHEWSTQPAGRARSMGMHESQSLFMEMQLGRSLAFLRAIQPMIAKYFGVNPLKEKNDLVFTPENLQRLSTEVRPGFIRVDADELTYPMHIILRYEIERALINREIEPEAIPDLWQEKMMSYLGVDTTGNYKDGCMQDIHWSMGAFGYFPTYSLGAMYAAQFAVALRRKHKAFDRLVGNGEFDFIFEFLDENVWKKASLKSVSQILVESTGEDLNPKHFQDHLQGRYLSKK